MIEAPISDIIGTKKGASVEERYKTEVLRDFWICCVSREASILGRKEVLGGKAKFGIMGDGKEVPQVAMARAFKKGDWRSGYYRDQTLMFALGYQRSRIFSPSFMLTPKTTPGQEEGR